MRQFRLRSKFMFLNLRNFWKSAMRSLIALAISTALAFCVSAPATAQGSSDELHHGFVNPPPEARPMMRWWWFGPATVKPELQKELETMRNAGIGGVEIQPVYPLMLD